MNELKIVISKTKDSLIPKLESVFIYGNVHCTAYLLFPGRITSLLFKDERIILNCSVARPELNYIIYEYIIENTGWDDTIIKFDIIGVEESILRLEIDKTVKVKRPDNILIIKERE